MAGVIYLDETNWVLEEGSSGPGSVVLYPTSEVQQLDATFEGCSADHVSHTAANTTTRRRQRRQLAPRGPASLEHTQCNVFIDADWTFFDKWKGSCAAEESAAKCTVHGFLLSSYGVAAIVGAACSPRTHPHAHANMHVVF